MDDKIFSEFHYQSGLVAQGCWDQLDEYDREAVRRFGDLIVQECINVIENSNDRYRRDYFAGKIKQHFGVK